MRKEILAAVACAAVTTAMPALAQSRGGGGPPAGVPAGGGMGAGPPITPPGQLGGGRTTADEARAIAESRGQFGRDFAQLRRMDGQERAAAYRQMTEQHRLNALQIAQMARRGPLPANAGGQIRDALKADLAAWREAFQVGRRDWQAMRDQWLVDRDSLTAEQWALQRANWFGARDAWIAQQVQWAQAKGQ